MGRAMILFFVLMIIFTLPGLSQQGEELTKIIEEAIQLRKDGEFEKAQKILENASAKFKQNRDQNRIKIEIADLNFNWGEKMMEKYEYEEAGTHFKKTYEIDKICRPLNVPTDLNKIGASYFYFRNYSEAIKYFERTEILARRQKNMEKTWEALNNISESYKMLREFQKSIEYTEKALDIATISRNRQQIGDSLNKLGSLYMYLNQLEKATNYFENAITIAIDLKNRKSEASILKNMGVAQLNLGNQLKALDFLNRSLAIYTELDEVRDKSNVLYFLGMTYNLLSRYEEAIECCKKGLEISTKIRNQDSDGSFLNILGVIYRRQSKYQQSIAAHEQALQLARKIKARRSESYYLANLGGTYLHLRQFDKAKDFLEQAIDIRREMGDRYGEALSLAGLGGLYLELSDFEKAVSYYDEALKIAQEIKNKSLEGLIFENLGKVYEKSGQTKKALENLNKALMISKELENQASIGVILNTLGLLYSSVGNYSEAEKYLFESIVILKKIRAEDDLSTSKIGLGYNYLSQGKKENAISEFEEALYIKDKIRFELKDEEMKISFFEKYLDVYRLLFKLYYESGNQETAFKIAEKSKNVVFAEMFDIRSARERLALQSKGFEKILKDEIILLRLISNLKTSIREAKKDKILQLTEKLDKLNIQLYEIRNEMKREYPSFSELLYPQPMEIKEFQTYLKADESYVTYYILQDYTVAFLVTQKNFQPIKLNISKEWIEDSIGSLRKQVEAARFVLEDISSSRWLSSDIFHIYSQYPEKSYELYNKLIKPILRYTKTKHIIISADGELYGFPIESLVSKRVKNISPNSKIIQKQRKGKKPLFCEFTEMHYFGDDYNLTYLPSASSIKKIRAIKNIKKENKVIAFADPIYSSDPELDERVKGKEVKEEMLLDGQIYVQSRAIRSWPPERLKSTAEEAIFFKHHVGSGKIYTGFEAKEEKVWSIEIENARYLLFSTHGILAKEFDNNLITEPALVLTLVDNPEGYDGLLGMSEVAGLRLNADLVILSACNSAGENGRGGEGFVGMARSFLFAGSNAVVASHWKVDDQTALNLMKEFSKRLKTKNPLDALSIARRKIKKRIAQYGKDKKIRVSNAHPFFWASFVYIEGR